MATGLTGHAIIILTMCSYIQGYTEFKRKESMKVCDEIAAKPYFSPDMVVGKPWRIYYGWYMELGKSCLEMKFKHVTPSMVTRIYNDMAEYLEEQPMWNAATLMLRVGVARHEILLFADQGPEGRFVGVLNVARDGRHVQIKNEVPLMRFQFKLYGKGKYLVMLDCHLGAGSISVRADQPAPTREEIDQLRDKHKLKIGYHACENYDPRNPIG